MTLNDEIEKLFKANYAGMHRLAVMLLHDSESAHDIVHDVFTSVLVKGNASGIDTGYLLAGVRNRCLNRLRSIGVRERFRRLYLVENDEEPDIADWPDEELLDAIENCERDLPPQCARVFRLRYHEGKTPAEIESLLGIGERAVFKHLRHALDIIRLKLNQNGQV